MGTNRSQILQLGSYLRLFSKSFGISHWILPVNGLYKILMIRAPGFNYWHLTNGVTQKMVSCSFICVTWRHSFAQTLMDDLSRYTVAIARSKRFLHESSAQSTHCVANANTIYVYITTRIRFRIKPCWNCSIACLYCEYFAYWSAKKLSDSSRVMGVSY